MKILAIDTSAMVASAAVLDENITIAEFSTNYKKTHSQTIMPMIESILKMIELSPKELDYIAVSSGPGSFTGLRIGAATAKGMAHGVNIPIVEVPTLDVLAYNIFETDKIICPIMDARRNQVYSALYMYDEEIFDKLTDYMADDIEVIIEKALSYNKKIIFLGDGVPVHLERLKELGDKALFAPVSCNRQRAACVGALALEKIKKGEVLSYSEFTPFYIRKSQAEREYEEKHNGV